MGWLVAIVVEEDPCAEQLMNAGANTYLNMVEMQGIELV
jgi:hypothetical protein